MQILRWALCLSWLLGKYLRRIYMRIVTSLKFKLRQVMISKLKLWSLEMDAWMGGWSPSVFICQCVRLEWYRDSDFIVLRGRFASHSVSEPGRRSGMAINFILINPGRWMLLLLVGDDDEAEAILFYVILKAVSSKINCLPRNNGIITDRNLPK